jgi:hypothetical protein
MDCLVVIAGNGLTHTHTLRKKERISSNVRPREMEILPYGCIDGAGKNQSPRHSMHHLPGQHYRVFLYLTG